jgi:hypothetical protein
MVPYITALVILIVAILFAVYKRVDAFEISTTTFKPTSTIGEIVKYLQKLLTRNTALLKRLESASEIKDTVTPELMNKLGIPPMAQGQTIQELLLDTSKQFQATFENVIQEFNKLNPSMKLQNIIVDSNDMKNFLTGLDMLESGMKERETYLNSKLGKAKVAGVDADDLYGAVGGSKEAIAASSLEEEIDVTKAKQKASSEHGVAPSSSPALTKEVEERIAKSVVTQIKDTLLSQRSTNNLMEDTSCPYASVDSSGTAQGKEYQHANPIQSAPDMSEYIRKDSIPCWNCSLP